MGVLLEPRLSNPVCQPLKTGCERVSQRGSNSTESLRKYCGSSIITIITTTIILTAIITTIIIICTITINIIIITIIIQR